VSDAATKLAQELKRGHKESKTWPGQCDNCEGDWPCAPRRSADMLLELAKDGERWRAFVELAMPEQWNGARLSWASNRGFYVVTVGSGYEIGSGATADDAIDAARNATQEKPNE